MISVEATNGWISHFIHDLGDLRYFDIDLA
jgi:hypothetical protein